MLSVMKVPARHWLMIVVSCGVLFSTQRSFGAVDMFLKLAGIDGESTDEAHPREIVALGFSQGVTSAGASGGGTGRASFTDLTIRKQVDAATPLLYLNAAQGTLIREAVLTVRSSGQTPFEFYRITLTDVTISHVQTDGAAGGERPTETVSLKFAAIEWRYVPQKADGTAGTPVVTRWNVAENRP